MRIERMKSTKLTGLGDVDWTLPNGPVLLFCEDRSHLRILNKLLFEFFYDQKSPQLLKDENSRGLLEVWMSGENKQFHILRDYNQQGKESERPLTQVSEEGTGQNISLPETSTLGDYLFQINLRAFRQGVVVEWPEYDELDHLKLRVNNLRQGGDEDHSLLKVRASLAGAQKRVNEQKGDMVQFKAEYDALRREWEAAHRQQDEERSLLIEIKKLQENEAIISERIASTMIIQERIALLSQNTDYRELRQLHEELTQLDDRIQVIDSNLAMHSDSDVDWAMIETLREECIEWASLKEKVENLTVQAQTESEQIAEMKGSLQMSGYEGLSKDENQRMLRAEEEMDWAKEELNKLAVTKADLDSTQRIYLEEIARLQDYSDLAGVTSTDEVKIEQWERRLKQWQSSKICCSLDRTLRKHFSETSIGERLASRLEQYYKGYHSSNFEEFTCRLKAFRDQQELVDRVKTQIEQLQEKLGREEKLRRTVKSHTEFFKQAFLAAKVADLPTWLNGWEEFQKKKDQLALTSEEMQLLLESTSLEEKRLQSCVEQLREKLGDWDTQATDRDDVLAVVFIVASQLRAKDETEIEIAAYSQRYNDLIGDRDLESLAKKLEPLADLERELRVSDEERLLELNAWQKERLLIRKQREEAERRLRDNRKFTSLPVLEKKIETAKQQWKANEGLHRAIDEALLLLESSWQEWQDKFGKSLIIEMKWILSKISSSIAQETIQTDQAKVKCEYFAYRMALVQLTLGDHSEAPLFFSIGDIDEGEKFWLDVIKYFSKLSLTRQIFFITTDRKLEEKLKGVGWSTLTLGS